MNRWEFAQVTQQKNTEWMNHAEFEGLPALRHFLTR